ncbi:unnamed protein product [Closterium sp. NIES-64]|nr:unnamed protein product [Closterium sp. NIES-64]
MIRNSSRGSSLHLAIVSVLAPVLAFLLVLLFESLHPPLFALPLPTGLIAADCFSVGSPPCFPPGAAPSKEPARAAQVHTRASLSRLFSAMQTTWLACCYSPPVRHRPAPLDTSALSLTPLSAHFPPIIPLSSHILHHRAALSRANHLAGRYSPPVRHRPASPQLPHSLLARHPTSVVSIPLQCHVHVLMSSPAANCILELPIIPLNFQHHSLEESHHCLLSFPPHRSLSSARSFQVVSPSASVTCVPPPTDLYYFRKSFPSAHAAVSFSAAVFLLLFLSRTIQRSFPQRPSPLDSPSHRPSHRHNHSPQHRTQSHQECNQPLQHPHQSHQSPEHPNANATSSPHNLLVIATPSPHSNFTATRLRDSLRASHLWRVPAVAWPLALAAGAGLADLDTYSNAPGDILAGVALGTLVAFIAYWRFFSPTRCGSESGISPWLGFELLRDGGSPPREPPSADTRLEVLVTAASAATAPATAAETAFATVPVTVGVAAAGRGTAGATGDAKADDSGGKEG